LRIEDGVMRDWFTLLTRLPLEEVEALLAGHFREAKARLAEEITAFFHGREAGRKAREEFDRQFRDKELPQRHRAPALAPRRAEQRSAAGQPAEGPGPREEHQRRAPLDRGRRRQARRRGGQGPSHVVRPPAKELLIQVGKRRFARVL
jgi:tyrosyl-tRNA synthetase